MREPLGAGLMTLKTAAIFHGSGGSADSFWIPWLKQQLEATGICVWAPSLPDKNGSADLDHWAKEVLRQSPHKNYDIVVGHSSGVPLILKLLSQEFSANHAVMVAGFMKPLPNTDETHPSYPKGFDIPRIRDNCKAFTFIHSDNDPWGCDVAQGEFMRQNFGGTLITCTDQGHFGSDSFDQPYKEFPMLRDHCLLGV